MGNAKTHERYKDRQRCKLQKTNKDSSAFRQAKMEDTRQHVQPNIAKRPELTNKT